MSFYKDKLKNIKVFIFDNDGVLSKDFTPLNEDGIPMRTSNVKDGFALKQAIEKGFIVAVITGAKSDRAEKRYNKFIGVNYYFDEVGDKRSCVQDLAKKIGVELENILYMGDDLIDYGAMDAVGLSACPKDAVNEVKEVAQYISDKNGGEGCVRDVIEQVLRSQDKWFTREELLDFDE